MTLTRRRHARPAKSFALLLLLVGAGLNVSTAGATAMNNPPPTGAILDLNGQLIDHGAPVIESVSFVGAVANTNITFAFREDPAYIAFSDVVLIDTTTGSTSLIQNGTFASGSGNTPTDWTYVNQYGSGAGGVVETNCSGIFATCWFDGSIQAYDAITQVVATTIGDTYTLSFAYSDNGQLLRFSTLSTNGDTGDNAGNGVDILAYAQAGVPAPGSTGVTPEPSSIMLLGTGTLGMAGVVRKRFHSAEKN